MTPSNKENNYKITWASICLPLRTVPVNRLGGDEDGHVSISLLNRLFLETIRDEQLPLSRLQTQHISFRLVTSKGCHNASVVA